jgi:hypothetical protein
MSYPFFMLETHAGRFCRLRYDWMTAFTLVLMCYWPRLLLAQLEPIQDQQLSQTAGEGVGFTIEGPWRVNEWRWQPEVAKHPLEGKQGIAVIMQGLSANGYQSDTKISVGKQSLMDQQGLLIQRRMTSERIRIEALGLGSGRDLVPLITGFEAQNLAIETQLQVRGH